ncbi:MAG: rhodanese-related sulfurtransferase [Bacteroidota bacterium]|nr:rhodanese-related sulfurtransferase [Bacteroidota bacterium]
MACVVAALYHFTPIADPPAFRDEVEAVMDAQHVRGTILVAGEGINGTVSGSREGIDALLAFLRSQPGMTALEHKESYTDECPFLRTKVRLKKEIVTLGIKGVDPNRTVGTYVDPQDWNDLISRDDVILIDTRNDYEYQVGSFKGALNPETRSFREFPDYVRENLNPEERPKIAMFCTGGIRCEKATSWLKDEGYDDVYHLKGGILYYLDKVVADESLWEGECFVFDGLVTVNHDLDPGKYDMCHACRMPISEDNMASEFYEPGVSCPYCHDAHDEADRKRLKERQRQVKLAKERGESHLGDAASAMAEQRRRQKLAQKNAQRRSLKQRQASD